MTTEPGEYSTFSTLPTRKNVPSWTTAATGHDNSSMGNTDHLPFIDDDPIEFEAAALRDFPPLGARLECPCLRIAYPIGFDLRYAPATAFKVVDQSLRPSRLHPIRRIRRGRAQRRATTTIREAW